MVKTYAHRGEDNATLADLVIGRGLSCDKSELLGILDAVGYYRFKGYLVPFYAVGSESFKSGTRLSDIWSVYTFDRNLRECVLSGIARLEVALRAMIVRFACQMDADPLAYTRDSFFPRLSAYERADLLLHIAKAVHQAKNEPFLEYAIKQYGFSDLPPIWTMMEVIPMGTLMTLYRGLPESVQAAISNAFHVRPAIFVGWFTMIRKVRNVCAHHGRLWNRHIQNPLTHKVGIVFDGLHGGFGRRLSDVCRASTKQMARTLPCASSISRPVRSHGHGRPRRLAQPRPLAVAVRYSSAHVFLPRRMTWQASVRTSRSGARALATKSDSSLTHSPTRTFVCASQG